MNGQQGRSSRRDAPPMPSRPRAAVVLVVFALGLALAGCDKCMNFIWDKPAGCRDLGPARH